MREKKKKYRLYLPHVNSELNSMPDISFNFYQSHTLLQKIINTTSQPHDLKMHGEAINDWYKKSVLGEEEKTNQ